MSCEIFKIDVENNIKKDLQAVGIGSNLRSVQGANLLNIENFVKETNKKYQSDIYGIVVKTAPIQHLKDFVELKINIPDALIEKYNNISFELTAQDKVILQEIKLEKEERAKNKNKATNFTTPNKTTQNSKVPLTDNFGELINHKEALLKQVERKISNLKKDSKDSRNNFEAINKEINRLIIIEVGLKETIENLNGKSEEYMFHAISEEIENISKILSLNNDSSINDIGETKDAIDFLSQFVKGVDINNVSVKGKLGLRKLNNPAFDKISSDIDRLIAERKDKQNELIKKILSENIVYFNNVDEKVDDATKAKILSDLENMDELKDIDLFSKYLTGVGESQTNDTILNQIAKTYLETRVVIRENQASKWKDKINALIDKIKGGFDFMYERDEHGTKTGDIISPITEKYREALTTFLNIGKVFGTSKAAYTEGVVLSKQIDWYNENAFIINPAKLKIFKDTFGTDKYPDNKEYYKYSDQEMQDYEDNLKSINPAMFSQAVKEMLNGLQNFENEKELLLNSNGKYIAKNIAKMNPYLFFNNKDKKQQISYTNDFEKTSFVFPNLKYVYFIPLEQKVISIDNNGKSIYGNTGFYNKAFDEIAKNKDKLAYWETIVEVYTEYIHPTFHNVYSSKLAFAKFDETMVELLTDPNVKIVKNIGKIGKSMVSRGIFAFKQLWHEKGRFSEVGNVLKTYSDNSKEEIERNVRSMKSLSNEEIKKLAKQFNIDTSKMTKEVAINQIATAEVMNSYSNNFNKTTIALINMASLQKAREDTAPVTDMLLEIHKMKSKGKRNNSYEKFEDWVTRVVKNHTLKHRGTDGALGKNYVKGSFIESILAWFGSTRYLKNLINEHSLKLLSDHDKFLIGNLKKAQKAGADVKSEGGFSIGDIKYAAAINEQEEGIINFVKIENNVRYSLTQEEYENAFQEHLSNELSEMGLDLSIAGVIEGVMKTIVMSRLGNSILGFTGGTFNRMEGKTTSLIMDATGNYWPTGSIDKADYFLAGSNMLHYADMVKEVNYTRNIQQIRIFQAMADKMNLMQDRKNELDKSAQSSQVVSDKIEQITNIYQFTVDRPEAKNQGAIALAILMGTRIMSKDGTVKTTIFDGDTGTFPAHELVDGKLVLKAEFRSEENISNWEDFAVDEVTLSNNQYLLTKLKIKKAVSKTQGNYDPHDTILMTKGIITKTLVMFLKWMPEHLMSRFGWGEHFDLTFGKMSPQGRYVHVFHDNTVLATAVAMAALVTVGPALGTVALATTVGSVVAGSLIYKAVMRKFYKKVYGGDDGYFNAVASLLKILGFTKAVLAATLNYPLQMVNISGMNKRYNKYSFNSGISNFVKKIDPSLKNTRSSTNLSQEQINNFSAVAREIAIQINYTMMLGLVAMLYYDDDDDEKSDRRMRYNFYHNQLSRMNNSIAAFTNPVDFAKDATRWAALSFVANAWEVAADILKGKDIGEIGKKSLKLTQIPTQITKFFDTGFLKDEKAFNPNWRTEKVIQDKTGIDKKVKKDVTDNKAKRVQLLREYAEEVLGKEGDDVRDFITKETAKPKKVTYNKDGTLRKPRKKTSKKEDDTSEEVATKLELKRIKSEKELKETEDKYDDE